MNVVQDGRLAVERVRPNAQGAQAGGATVNYVVQSTTMRVRMEAWPPATSASIRYASTFSSKNQAGSSEAWCSAVARSIDDRESSSRFGQPPILSLTYIGSSACLSFGP